MLPICSSIGNCYSNAQVCLHGGRSHKAFTVNCIMQKDGAFPDKFGLPFKTYFGSNFVGRDEHLQLKDQFIQSSSQRPFIATNFPVSDSLNASDLSSQVFTQINDSLGALVCNTDTAITNTLNTITSSMKFASKGVNDTVDASLDNVKLSLTSTLSGLSKNVSVVDGLRRVIVTVEGFLTQGATFLVYAYASVKDMLPPELRNVLNSSEDNFLRPVGTAFQQVYIVLEGFEMSIGIDPSDPIIPFVLLLGTSTTLWVSYWILTYAGYAGDLSPKLTLELLNGKESVALIDVRPEDFRERDGIPDLRRTARFRYASLAVPEVDANVKKLLKSGKEFDDALVAVVIRNLKVVQEGSKVIVMDADGGRSKGIARSLRKVGIKRPYLLQGGFRSWVQEGLRVKEPKPETTFTILNEEAEAILEEITPLRVIGYGVGLLAAAYALSEWETTLQVIAVIGIGQTIYRRVASYEDSKDFNRDVRQLLVPVKLGGQAISWAAGKLETNRNGLPTSPSSVNIQNRVLQAAAKHESQPPDTEEPQDSSTSVDQNPELSEA